MSQPAGGHFFSFQSLTEIDKLTAFLLFLGFMLS